MQDRLRDEGLLAGTNLPRRSRRMMLVRVCALLLLTMLANGASTEDPKRRIVVEQTQSNFEAERAGIQKDDVLLRWSRGDAHGEIESPFDLMVLEIDQEPRGPVTLEGLRGGEKLSWKLGPNSWRIKARPDLAADVLAEYLRGEDLVHAGKLTDAAKLWRGLADQVAGREPAWLASWVMLHTAESLTAPSLPKDADDAYQQAVEFSASAGTGVRGQLFRAWALQCEQRGDLE